MIARLICWWRGHKRGKRLDWMTVKCPRCGRSRKREQKTKTESQGARAQ